MKVLVIFYSRTGHTRKVAQAISDALACDIEEIIDTKWRSGPIGFIRSGREAMKKSLTTLKDIQSDLSQYDMVIIGTPVWGGNISTPVRTFIHENKDQLKKVAFFSTQGGEDAGNIFVEMEEMCGNPPVSVLSIQSKKVDKPAYTGLVQGFVNGLTK
jgi:flavodoxin